MSVEKMNQESDECVSPGEEPVLGTNYNSQADINRLCRV